MRLRQCPPMPAAATLRTSLQETIGRAVVGQQQVIDGLLLAVLTGGHVLLEASRAPPRR